MKITGLINELKKYADQDPETEVTIALSVSAKGVLGNKNFIIRNANFPVAVHNDSRTVLEQSNHVVLMPPEMDETAMALWEAKHRKGNRKNTQETAHWIATVDRIAPDGFPINAYTCSHCGGRGSLSKFCMNCGALMREKPTFPEEEHRAPGFMQETVMDAWQKIMYGENQNQ